MTSHGDDVAFGRLAAAHPELAKIIDTFGSPVTFTRPPTFQTLVLLILEQQVSLDSARAAYDRLEAAIPGIEPPALLGLDDTQLRNVGFSRQKTRYTRELADRVITGALDLESLTDMDDAFARTTLMQVPGIGVWTADVFLMSSLGRPDIWPIGDRALQVAVAEALNLEAVPDPRQLEGIGERWRPDRTAAAGILWHGYLGRRGRTIPGS